MFLAFRQLPLSLVSRPSTLQTVLGMASVLLQAHLDKYALNIIGNLAMYDMLVGGRVASGPCQLRSVSAARAGPAGMMAVWPGRLEAYAILT